MTPPAPHRLSVAGRTALALLTLAAATTAGAQTRAVTRSSDYLYLWTASADTTQPDFLAVVDVRPTSTGYGQVITTVPVPGRRNVPHHTEHALAGDGTLFANGFASGQSFVFDLSTPAAPRLAAQFGDIGGLAHPHSYLRLPNGNVLATFQMQHVGDAMRPGGLAELTPQGAVVRTASADGSGVDARVRPYSAAVMPVIDRIVTTTTDMDGDDELNDVQLWRLSDFTRLATFTLPNGPRGNEGALTAEPRLLPDGRSLLLSTFNCGLYHVQALDTPSPVATLVASFPQKVGTSCAIPVIVGNYYLVTVPAWNAVVSLDISDPSKPREVSRLTLGADDVPHWIAIEPNHQRLVITGYRALKHRVVLASFNEQTGALALDRRFGDADAAAPGLRLDAVRWPHGGTAAGIPHGAVFSR